MACHCVCARAAVHLSTRVDTFHIAFAVVGCVLCCFLCFVLFLVDGRSFDRLNSDTTPYRAAALRFDIVVIVAAVAAYLATRVASVRCFHLRLAIAMEGGGGGGGLCLQ